MQLLVPLPRLRIDPDSGPSRSSESRGQKRTNAFQCPFRSFELPEGAEESVRQALPHMDFSVDASCNRPFDVAHRVIEEYLVVTDVDKNGR